MYSFKGIRYQVAEVCSRVSSIWEDCVIPMNTSLFNIYLREEKMNKGYDRKKDR